MGASCAGCGACCEALRIPLSSEEIAGKRAIDEDYQKKLTAWYEAGNHQSGYPEESDPSIVGREDARFIAMHWNSISPGEAERRLPGITARDLPRMVDGKEVQVTGSYYECDQFDTQSKLCLAHDTKPPVCRDFPYYGHDPLIEKLYGAGTLDIYPACSYWHDLPGDQWPTGINPLPSPQIGIKALPVIQIA